MAIHSSVLAWRIPGIGEPGGLPSMGLHSQTRLKRLSSSSSSSFRYCDHIKFPGFENLILLTEENTLVLGVTLSSPAVHHKAVCVHGHRIHALRLLVADEAYCPTSMLKSSLD